MYEVLSSRIVGAKVGDRIALEPADARAKVRAGLVRKVEPKPTATKATKAATKGDD